MINLLPLPIKQSYRYARYNVYLRRWLTAFAIALVGLGLLGGSGVMYLRSLSADYQQQIAAERTTLERQKLTITKNEAKDISGSIKLAVTVLSEEVLFSELLEQLATATPPNVRLAALNISETTGALTITAESTNYDAGAQLQTNLADPANKIFAKADLVNITCDSQDETGYPCTVNIQALFAKDNPFLFINSEGR